MVRLVGGLQQGDVACHPLIHAGAPCSAKLRNGGQCRSVATDAGFCAYHGALAAELGSADKRATFARMLADVA